MCRVRIIKKDKDDKVIKDVNADIQTSLNPIDRPSFIEIVASGDIIITLIYVGSDESKDICSYNEIQLKKGIASGRIYTGKFSSNILTATDIFNLKQICLGKDATTRQINNVTFGISLLINILDLIRDEKI